MARFFDAAVWRDRLAALPELTEPQQERFFQFFRIFCVVYFLWWILLPNLVLGNDFIDILENIVWGSNFQWGYDKNPYLGAWIGYWGYAGTGGWMPMQYILSQIFALISLAGVWFLTRDICKSRLAALLAVLVLGLSSFYGAKTLELRDDVMELGFWMPCVLFFFRALKYQRARTFHWLLCGLFAGMAFMIKYYGLVLFASMGAVVLFTPEGRKAFRMPGLYLAGLVFLLISAPNIWYIVSTEFQPIRYALARANLDQDTTSAWRYLTQPLETVRRAAGGLLPLVALVAFFFLRAPEKYRIDRFDRIFVNVICWGPLALSICFSLITGGKIQYSWMLPCFSLVGLFYLVNVKPRITLPGLGLLVAAVALANLAAGLVFADKNLNYQLSKKRACDDENFPGKAMATHITDAWHRQYRTPIPYVVGNRRTSCNFAVYSPDFPAAYFDAHPLQSPWIDETDLRRRGGVVIWEDTENLSLFHDLKKRGFPLSAPQEIRLERARRQELAALSRKPPKKISLYYCWISPRP